MITNVFAVFGVFFFLNVSSVFSNSTHISSFAVLKNKDVKFKEPPIENDNFVAETLLPEIDSLITDKFNETVIVPLSLHRMLDIFNTEILAASWPKLKNVIGNRCKRDVGNFLNGLKNGDTWALKMEDASGRYSEGWFWGNHFWLGSYDMCEAMNPKENKIVVSAQKSRSKRGAEVDKKRSHIAGVTKLTKINRIIKPPFPVSFFTLKLIFNTTFSVDKNTIFLGVCLPHSCSDEDIYHIITETSKINTHVNVDIESIKSPHNKYNMWADPILGFLLVITFLVGTMMFIGTCYDFHLSNQMEETNNTTRNDSLENSKEKQHNFDALIVQRNYKCKSVYDLVVKEALLSFSVKTNLKIICDLSVGSDTISIIHGLKSLSMGWVILAHTCIIVFSYSDNREITSVINRGILFQTINNGSYSVDTFFFSSGLLLSFLYFRTSSKGKLDPLTKGTKGFFSGFMHFIGLLAYRFARLTAPYFMAILFLTVLMKWFNYNSVFETPAADHFNCPNYWWRNILYINTFFPYVDMCMLWSWYLADDTQFYVIGSILLVIAASRFRLAASIFFTLLMASWATTSLIAYKNDYRFDADPLDLFDEIYDKPWTRFGPYLIGMAVGWYLFKKDCKVIMSKTTATLGWTVSISSMTALVYAFYYIKLSPVGIAMHSALSHTVWALGMAWIVIACTTGYGGFVNKILSAPILYPFSRVTYCVYLIHTMLIRGMVMTSDTPFHLSHVTIVILFIGITTASYMIGFVFSLAFEAPVVGLLRIMQKIIDFQKEQIDRRNRSPT